MKLSWQEAVDFVEKLNVQNYCGYSDWRLPSIKELLSLVNYSNYDPALPTGHPFTNVQFDYYWSSSTYANNTNYAWNVHMWDGYVTQHTKATNTYYVWPMRNLCEMVRSDYLQPRFIDNNDGTITDNLTGLMWTKDVNINL